MYCIVGYYCDCGSDLVYWFVGMWIEIVVVGFVIDLVLVLVIVGGGYCFVF